MIANIRDLVGYTLDLWDEVLLRHRFYSFCKFISVVVMTEEDTEVSRVLQPFWNTHINKDG